MLGLKLPTDPRWVNIAEMNIEEILTDHAFCEQKAASTAMSLIVSFPEFTEVVTKMISLVEEEISHFKMVHDLILNRGFTLGRDRKDNYVVSILKFFPKGGSRTTQLIHRLLSENLKDKKLAKFYKKLMISEAHHYTMFLNLARKYGDRELVDKKWELLLQYEAKIMGELNNHESIHG